MSTWDAVFFDTGLRVMSRAELLGCGATPRGLTTAVRGAFLIRLRRDHYCLPGLARQIRHAVRVGGRLACVSALERYGVFVYDAARPHIHLTPTASRLRAPTERLQPLSPHNRSDAVLHWQLLGDTGGGDEYCVGLIDALAQVVCCQTPALAIASIDNALHLRMIDDADVAEIFRLVPANLRRLRAFVDSRAEAGQETVLRLIALGRGLSCELQPTFRDIGRADILVSRRVVLEADSRAHHDGWEKHLVDRERDLKFARLGYPSLRPAYQHTMQHPRLVGDAIEALVRRAR